MRTRRSFLTITVGAALGLGLVACSPAAPPAPSKPAEPAKPAETAKPAAAAAEAAKPAAQVAPAAKASGGAIVFVLENDVIDFDPLRSRAFVDRNVHYQIYDSLVAIDATGKIIPWLAEKWEIAPDGKAVTFNLRKGVKFHDGNPFDAEAVKWNIDRYRTTQGSARSGELAPVDNVAVVDPSTVRFNLKSPFSPLLSLLVDRAGMMVSPKAAEAGGADFTRKAFKAGTGPFVLTAAVKDVQMVLERNADWWGKDVPGGGLPSLDKITVKPITNGDVRLANLKTGDAHIANNISPKDVADVKAQGLLNYQERPGLNYQSLIPNRKPGMVFAEGKYVKAVSLALDRAEILQRAYFGVGTVAYGTIAPPHFAHDTNWKPYEKADPEAAKKLVTEVGKGPLTFEFLVPAGDPFNLQIAQLIQAQLKKADITAEIKQLEFAQILKLQTDKEFAGMTQIGWSGRIDPDGNTYDHIYTGRPFNDPSYTNKDVDMLLDQQRAESDQTKRREALRKAEQIYAVDDPARVWFRFGVAQLVTSKKLQGLEPYPDQIIRFQNAKLT